MNEILEKANKTEDKSLLIVDDDNIFRDRLARSMQKKGFEVIQAEGVQQGLERATVNKPYFAVVDLRLNDGKMADHSMITEINGFRSKITNKPKTPVRMNMKKKILCSFSF